MVTGVETAGLVLGAFPVAIECIRVYMKGASRIKKMIQYKVILEVFLQDLETEKCIFQDLCEDLLEPYCEADEIKELIKDPGGTSWSAEAIKDILQHHLTPQSIPIFLTVMKRLDDNLGMLAVRFQPQPPDFTTNQSLDFDDKATCSKICVQLARAWKTGMLLEYRDEKMRCIRLLNANLQKLLRKSIHEGGSRGNKSRPTPIASLKAIETFNSTRKQAQAAFSILKGHVLNMCNCNGASHSISLQLEQHMILSKKPGGQQGNKSSQTREKT
ncbi:hypothetical protein DFH27DRAFT_53025 [Peziza echinospora]|nr:hypothetical protein DFH27DRAFT_53025 [Peziza echinospora]